MGLSGAYLVWGNIGKMVTGCFPYYWMDPAEVGSIEAVTAYSIGFVLMAPVSKSTNESKISLTLIGGSVCDDAGFRGHPPRTLPKQNGSAARCCSSRTGKI